MFSLLYIIIFPVYVRIMACEAEHFDVLLLLHGHCINCIVILLQRISEVLLTISTHYSLAYQ